MSENSPIEAMASRDIVVAGRVQGVGFRPFVQRLAQHLNLVGWVRNHAGTVHIRVSGSLGDLERFTTDLIAKAPPFSQPQLQEVVSSSAVHLDKFTIVHSETGDARTAEIAPDQSTCEECFSEIRDHSVRRYRYPFTNCTQCGPRYTIIRSIPYDRANTTMTGFALCESCRREYEDPSDRRFHAEPIACPACGPRLTFVAKSGNLTCTEEKALAEAAALLLRGMIVAVKGIGGYHLLCDATREDSVARLRQAKRRPHKPFAVMVAHLPSTHPFSIHHLAEISAVEEAALFSPARPIVLVRKSRDSRLAALVAPGLREVGLMLPYSPLHQLLLDAVGRPVVATSANISGEPVLTTESDVERRLADCCDGYLHHNRSIERPADDPVVRVIAGKSRTLRLGRGTAPLSIEVPQRIPEPIIACGGQLKATVALGFDRRVIVSPHIGDMGSLRSIRVFEQTTSALQSLFGVTAKRLIHDSHPDFSTTRWSTRQNLSSSAILHHAAHASALAGEYGRTRPMLVFTWDGMGLGADDTLWGGETFLGCPGEWRRVSTFRSFQLVGGDRVAYEPWRSACSICWESGIEWGRHRPEYDHLRSAWRDGSNAQRTSSVGRLFDAAAALLGAAETASYDGQAPALVEAVAEDLPECPGLPVVGHEEIRIFDWAPVVQVLLDRGLPVSERAAIFHSMLAATIVAESCHQRGACGINSIGLTGGVFQNRLLTERASELLEAEGFEVLLHERIPPNDGGLSFGQLVEFAARSVAQ